MILALAGRVAGWLLRIAAILLIVLAVLVGILRLLLPLVPDYQDQIRELAGDTTGLEVDFARITATWPIRGPELRLLDVQVSLPGSDAPLFQAEELRLGLSLRALLLYRELAPDRVMVSGSALSVERLDERNRIRVNGAELDWPLDWPAGGRPLYRMDLRLREITLDFIDQRRVVPAVSIDLARLDARLDGERLALEVLLGLPEEVGRRVELTAAIPRHLVLAGERRGDDNWQLQFGARDIALDTWLALALDMPTPVQAGRLDLDLSARLRGWSVRSLSLRPALTGLVLLPEEETDDSGWPAWDRLALRVGYVAGEDGWSVVADELEFSRGGRPWPEPGFVLDFSGEPGGAQRLDLRAGWLSLDDLYPLLTGIASAPLRERVLPAEVSGELFGWRVQLELEPGAEPGLSLTGGFSRLGLRMPEGVALSGLSGQLSASAQDGLLELDSEDAVLNWPGLFSEPLEVRSARGRVSWQRVAGGLDLSSDGLEVRSDYAAGRTTFQASLRPGRPAEVALQAEISAERARDALRYVPRRLPPPALAWLDRAIGPGQLHQARIDWSGPTRGFPYERVPGRFVLELDVRDATLDYAPGWPLIESADATVVIDGIRLYSRSNRGRIGGIAFSDADIDIVNLRQPQLEVSAAQPLAAQALLEFMQASPLREVLGPTLDQVAAAGVLDARLDLAIPLQSPRDWWLDAKAGISDGRLALGDFPHALEAIEGEIQVANTRVLATDVRARFLGEPVTVSLMADPPEEPAVGQVAEAIGSTPIGQIGEAFRIPWTDRLEGGAEWRTVVRFPQREPGEDALPVRISVESSLFDVASRLPAPLDKSVGVAENLELEIELQPAQRAFELRARLQRGIHAALLFEDEAEAGWQLRRGLVQAGVPPVAVPDEEGLRIDGFVERLQLEDWLSLAMTQEGEQLPALLRRVDLAVDRLEVLGREFEAVAVEAQRNGAAWQVSIDAPAVAGRIEVPLLADNERPVQVDLDRLWLAAPLPRPDPAEENGRIADPRRVLPAQVAIGDFRFGELHLGQLDTQALRTDQGLRVEPLQATSEAFTVTGSAAWLMPEDGRERTELSLVLESRDIAATLAALGYEPVIDGNRARLELDLAWRGGPGENPAEVANGNVRIEMRRGQLLQLEPGGGRFLGLLSIAALPKRLALDFRDVLDRGLTFDELRGDFRLESGNAWTCNLGLEGSVTDIALVGRVGLKDRDYEQLAVVRPHVSDVLAIGGFVGGPAIGATVLLLSQIFRRPLAALGETYYRITGDWEQPVVSRVQRSEIDTTPFRDCERYLAEVLPEPLEPLLLPLQDAEQAAEDDNEHMEERD